MWVHLLLSKVAPLWFVAEFYYGSLLQSCWIKRCDDSPGRINPCRHQTTLLQFPSGGTKSAYCDNNSQPSVFKAPGSGFLELFSPRWLIFPQYFCMIHVWTFGGIFTFLVFSVLMIHSGLVFSQKKTLTSRRGTKFLGHWPPVSCTFPLASGFVKQWVCGWLIYMLDWQKQF